MSLSLLFYVNYTILVILFIFRNTRDRTKTASASCQATTATESTEATSSTPPASYRWVLGRYIQYRSSCNCFPAIAAVTHGPVISSTNNVIIKRAIWFPIKRFLGSRVPLHFGQGRGYERRGRRKSMVLWFLYGSVLIFLRRVRRKRIT